MVLPPTRVLWHVPGARDFLWHDLGPVAALFNPASGDTHLLDLFSREVIELLGERPRSTRGAAEALAAGLERPCDAEFEARVEEAIAEFDRLGLVFPLAEDA